MQTLKIIHVDDEVWLLEMIAEAIKADAKFRNVNLQTFQNRDEALEELLRAGPDLLITDLRSDNVPAERPQYGMSGFELLSQLAKGNVKYPILVLSGCLAVEGHESLAKQCAGPNLNVSYLTKPVTTEQLHSEISKLLKI